jgi:hypothetical protein
MCKVWNNNPRALNVHHGMATSVPEAWHFLKPDGSDAFREFNSAFHKAEEGLTKQKHGLSVFYEPFNEELPEHSLWTDLQTRQLEPNDQRMLALGQFAKLREKHKIGTAPYSNAPFDPGELGYLKDRAQQELDWWAEGGTIGAPPTALFEKWSAEENLIEMVEDVWRNVLTATRCARLKTKYGWSWDPPREERHIDSATPRHS